MASDTVRIQAGPVSYPVVVDGCLACPFCIHDEEDWSCQHPANDGAQLLSEDFDHEPIPDWCPLRQGETVVRLKAEAGGVIPGGER